jgi:hypothetical protein
LSSRTPETLPSAVGAAGVVDDRLERSGRVRLNSKFARLFDAGQISLERGSRAWYGAQSLLRPIAVAPMQHDVVAEPDQTPGGQLSKSISRAGNKDASHAPALLASESAARIPEP